MKSNKLISSKQPLIAQARKVSALCVLAVVALLAGCDNGGSSGYTAPPAAMVEVQTEFSGFVEDQFANTADDTEPLAIEELDFSFVDQDDPTAFDALLEQ
jgi:hypothetical protein